MDPRAVKKILGEKSLLAMYRDCLKAVPIMNQNPIAQKAIKSEFRKSFERQQTASEAEVNEFKQGIVRILSNLVIYEVKKQYKEDPARFSRNVNIHDVEQQEEEERELKRKGIEVPDTGNVENIVF